ncbi:hypothetical protein [Paraburkholderia graminis]|uniref:hypothetical protein n=1 Tax=Paraburkholderia graminis TaxID=60548 RepID=UPI00286A9DE2|nr:hypothetical protein [Paraburkholderia graminis]
MRIAGGGTENQAILLTALAGSVAGGGGCSMALAEWADGNQCRRAREDTDCEGGGRA